VNRRRAVNAALVLFGLLLFGWRLGGHDLWPPDEPRFGLVAREMLDRGDPIVLSRNGRLYTDKPPLFFWAIDTAAILRGGGVDETAARMPSLIASVIALLLIARLGERLYDRATGVLGAVLFATSLQILERARWASIDMTLNVFILLAILLLWEEAEGEGGRRRWRAVAAWGAMGLATLAKGPVGLVLPLLALVPALIVLRRARDLPRLFPPAGVALFLAVVAAWFVPFAARLGPAEAVGIATHQTVDRYVNAWNSRHPVWYYLWRFPAGFLPWSTFLPAALLAAWRPERPDAAGDPAGARERGAAIFLTVWSAAILIFFSFSTGKRGVYIIPMYPAAALLVARLFTRAASARRAARGAFAFAPLAIAVGLAVALAVPRRHPEFRAAAWTVAGLLAAAAAATAWLAVRRRARLVPWGIAAAMTLVMLVACETVLPGVNRHLNLSRFAAEVQARRDPSVPLGATEEKREAWVFYLRTTVEELDEPDAIAAWIAAGPDRDLLIEDAVYRALRPRLPPEVSVAYTGRVSGRPFHLLSRRTPAPAAGAPR
jgi:4-amino-4-deoxy-L-arabinose transferase-like glycosyltransferase